MRGFTPKGLPGSDSSTRSPPGIWLERAVAADGRFPMAHAALALAWSTLGYDERAKASARKAFELSSGLSREERLSVEGAYRETAREWTTAIDIYQTLFRFFPDNLEYGLRLANAQVASGAAKDALATIAAIRTPGRAADPRIDLAEAAAAETVSDFKRMRAAAEAAGQRGDALGARLLVARARLLEGTAALRLGEPDRALTLYDQARATFDEAGDRGALARALNDQASVLTDHGDTARGIQIYGEALEIARAIGQQQLVARLLNNLAIMKRRAGDFAGSLAFNREALAIRREIGDRANSRRCRSTTSATSCSTRATWPARRGTTRTRQSSTRRSAIGAGWRGRATTPRWRSRCRARWRACTPPTRKRWRSAARLPTREARRFPSTTSARCWRSRATW